MRTHRMKITCNCIECANYLKDEILAADFCDLTHWYCGLDNAGEDTPDDCIIYQGELYPNVLYNVSVELGHHGVAIEPFSIFIFRISNQSPTEIFISGYIIKAE